MLQIFDISSSTNWHYELLKTCAEFEKEYGVKPHLYMNNDFKYTCAGYYNNVIWYRAENGIAGRGMIDGYDFELDDVIEPGVVLLKG